MQMDEDFPRRYRSAHYDLNCIQLTRCGRSPEESTDQTTSPPTVFSRESSATAHTSETTDPQTTSASRLLQTIQIQDCALVESMPLIDNDHYDSLAGSAAFQVAKAFDFFDDRLSDNLRIQIIKHTCVLDESEKPEALGEPCIYRPLYRAGMRLGMLTDSDDPDSGHTPERDQRYQRHDNVNWPKASISKRFARLYWMAWYGINSFKFSDPRAAKWWFKNIGDQKLSYVKEIELNITSGFCQERLRMKEPNTLLDESSEELWYGVLSWLQYRHNLKYVKIMFLRWPDPASFTRSRGIGGISEGNVEDLTMARTKLFGKLWALRGITHPTIIDRYGHAFANDKNQIPEIELGLAQKRKPRAARPRKSWTTVLDSVEKSSSDATKSKGRVKNTVRTRIKLHE